MFSCEYCGKEFEKIHSRSAHYSHCEKRLGKEKYEEDLDRVLSRQKLAIQARDKQRKRISEERSLAWISEKHTCENCGKVMTEKYASGRFCSRSCSNGFVSKTQSRESKEQKSKIGKANLLKRYSKGFKPSGAARKEFWTEEVKKSFSNSMKVRRYPILKFKLQKTLNNEFAYYSGNYLTKFLIRLGYKERKCEKCGGTEWLGRKIPIELHHKNGDHKDNSLTNLELLCPNCHAQTENYRWKAKSFRSLKSL